MTQKALDALEQTDSHIRQEEAKLVRGMSEEDAAHFRRLLQQAARNLGVCAPHPHVTQKKEEAHP